jgi:hypothetical protein
MSIRYGQRRSIPFLLAIALALSVHLAGCGDGNEESAPELTKAQFIKRADAICEQTEKRQEAGLQAYAKRQGHTTSLSEEAVQEKVVLEVGLPPVERQLEELRQLSVPSDGEETVGAILAALEKAIIKAKADPHSMLEPSANPFNGSEALARSYGLKTCGGA